MEKINRLLDTLTKEAMVSRRKYIDLEDSNKYGIGKEMNRERDEVIRSIVHQEIANTLQRIIMGK